MQSKWLALTLALGLSLLMSGCAESPGPSEEEDQFQAPEGTERTFEAGFLDVWRAARAVLAEKSIPIAIADPGRGLIISESVELSPEELARLSTASEAQARHGGRYVLQLEVTTLSRQQTNVEAALLLIAYLPLSTNPLGGALVKSSGLLEASLLEAIEPYVI